MPSCYFRQHKTYNSVLRHFFWPQLKYDVFCYCHICHVCHVTSKANQVWHTWQYAKHSQFPVTGSALSAKFSGPYVVVENLSETNFIVQTLDRR